MFVAGFASGWLARSTVDSSRGMAVAVVATYMGAVERVKRIVAIEREHLSDLVAEGRAKFEMDRARARVRKAAAPHVTTEGARQEKAA